MKLNFSEVKTVSLTKDTTSKSERMKLLAEHVNGEITEIGLDFAGPVAVEANVVGLIELVTKETKRGRKKEAPDKPAK